jgi:tetratricopeptide (TPR) repeat protein
MEHLADALTGLARERVRIDRDPVAAGTIDGVLTDEKVRRVLAELFVVAQDTAAALITAREPEVKIAESSEQAQEAVRVLRTAASDSETAANIAYEYEALVAAPPSYGDPGPPDDLINRAAAQWYNQLCLVSGRTDLTTWRDYARFCARVQRKEAAEEALRHIIYYHAEADSKSKEFADGGRPVHVGKEVDGAHPGVLKRFLEQFPKATACDVALNYGILLLDRNRFAEAQRTFRAVLEHDRSDPMHNLAYALFLWCRLRAGLGEADDGAIVAKFVSLARKPLDFFKGLTHGTDKQLFDKLRLFDRDEVSDSEEEKKLPTLILEPPADEIGGCRFARILIECGAPRLALDMLASVPGDGVAPFPALTAQTKAVCPLVEHLRARALMRMLAWEEATTMCKDIVYAQYVDEEGQAHHSPQLWGDYAECLYWTGDDPTKAAARAQDVTESLLPEEFAEPRSPVPGYRAGIALMKREQYSAAMSHLLESISVRPTAAAWSAVGLAAYRLWCRDYDEKYSRQSFEALTEASVRNTEHPETWAVLCLWHCRMRNDIVAKRSFQILLDRVCPDLDILLEVGWAMLPIHVPFSFAAARRALSIRDEGLGHYLLGEAWAKDDNAPQGVLEMAIAIGMLWSDVERRAEVCNRAKDLCDELGDAPLRESVLFADRKASQKLEEYYEEMERQRKREAEKAAMEAGL